MRDKDMPDGSHSLLIPSASEPEYFLTVVNQSSTSRTNLSNMVSPAAVVSAVHDIGSYRSCTLHKHHSRTLVIVIDIARDNEALQAATRVDNPKCKGMTRRY